MLKLGGPGVYNAAADDAPTPYLYPYSPTDTGALYGRPVGCADAALAYRGLYCAAAGYAPMGIALGAAAWGCRGFVS